MFKYRVKFYCYHYNTGSANNCSYWNDEDFETFQQAYDFKKKLLKQGETYSKYENKLISYDRYEKFINSDDYYDVEEGFIYYSSPIYIVKYFPEREEPLTEEDYAE
jgi:hypothetical protein